MASSCECVKNKLYMLVSNRSVKVEPFCCADGDIDKTSLSTAGREGGRADRAAAILSHTLN